MMSLVRYYRKTRQAQEYLKRIPYDANHPFMQKREALPTLKCLSTTTVESPPRSFIDFLMRSSEYMKKQAAITDEKTKRKIQHELSMMRRDLQEHANKTAVVKSFRGAHFEVPTKVGLQLLLD